MSFLQNCAVFIVGTILFVMPFVYYYTKAQKTYWKYLWCHKWFVFRECWKMAFPKFGYNNFRLIWLGIIHDWRKFLPYSYHAYANNFYGTPCIAGGLEEKERKKAFMNAMRAHMKSNKHHWRHWCFVGYKERIGSVVLDSITDATVDWFPIVPTDMPEIYVKELVADWAGAGRAINGKIDPSGWYENVGGKMRFTEITKLRIQTVLEEYYE